MRNYVLTGALALMIPTAALSHPGGGGGGGMGMGGMGGPPAGMGGMGNPGMGGISDMGSTMRDQGRMNSQGPAHASQTGIDHANQNSVLAGTTSTKSVTSGALAGLTTGTKLYSNGTAVGTVQQIRMTGNGSVAVVIVKGTNGGLYAVPANKLSLSGGTLSTSAHLAGINGSSDMGASASAQGRANSQGPLHASATGIAHASPNSVLARGAVSSSTLPGLTTGLTVKSTTGTSIGTISQVITRSDGSIRAVIVTSPTGQTFRLAPSTLSISGSLVTTTSTNIGG